MNGIIIKALSGFYYVAAEDRVIACRARGKFRLSGDSPLVGDRVTVSESEGQGVVEQILPRKNAFVRPAVANLDAIVLVASAAIPVTDPFLVDRMTVLACRRGIECIICINKTDLDPAEELRRIYTNTGFPLAVVSAETGEGMEELRALIRGKTVALTGNSGVGKSALLRRLCPELELATGEVSQKLGRGRHTTRHIELFALGDRTYAADTPGFSSFDTDQTEHIPKQDLEQLFPDFSPYLGHCRFPDCAHRNEPDCGVLEAVRAGKIEASRHRSYVRLYAQAEQIKAWELKKE